MAYDAIVVLGRGINQDGTLPVDPMWRVRRALELFNAGAAPTILMSGASSYHFDFHPPRSEAEAMKAWAVSLGAPPEQVLTESKSRDTLGNALYIKAKAQRNGWKSLVVVASDEHMDRVRYIFGKVFGPQFPIAFEESERVIDAQKYADEVFHERNSMRVLAEWLDDIEPGDHKAIWAVLKEKHPAYSTAPIEPTASIGRDLFPDHP